MPIKVAQLRTFATVAQCGNIKDAAARLARTPSAVSMALKQLEEELGGCLFEADRKTTLTPLGRYVLDTAKEELLRFERAVEKMRAFAGNRVGRLELACVPTVAVHILPAVIRAFVAGRPEVQLEVWDMDSLSVRRAVERGEVDLGIASPGRAEARRRLRNQSRPGAGSSDLATASPSKRARDTNASRGRSATLWARLAQSSALSSTPPSPNTTSRRSASRSS